MSFRAPAVLLLGVLGWLSAAGRTQPPANRAAGDGSPSPGKVATKPATRLGIAGTRFTVNGTPTFLLGLSYYGALGAAPETAARDLDEIQRRRFQWLRVWATWAAFAHDVSAVDPDGRPRTEYLRKLQALVAECDRRGLIVDVTLSRGNGATGPPRLQGLAAHRRAVETLVTALRAHRNWYLDLSNERNIQDKRHTPVAELKELRALVRQLDPDRLVTASHAGDLTRGQVQEYLGTAQVDFLAPHRPRNPQSPGQTEAKTRASLAWAQDLGRAVPVHYQEPFRRGFGKYEPTAQDFLTDLQAARAAGAAGWCFHTGDQRNRPDGRPRRCFDLRDGRLFDQLDAVEREALEGIR
jgi:hypothetical protein